MDIVIYTNDVVLAHKKKDGLVFWQFGIKSMPKKISLGDKIYFATNGQIRGYFKPSIVNGDDQSIDWDSKTWTNMREKVVCKPFRGMRYKWW